MKKYTLDENGNPRPEACRAVAAQLRRAAERYPAMELNMDEGMVKADWHPCGTVHCHAGAFLLGGDPSGFSGSHVDWLEGKIQMAVVLGFPSAGLLPVWCMEHPERWGNEWGFNLFWDENAFDGAETVGEIAEWWDGVAVRSAQLNAAGG